MNFPIKKEICTSNNSLPLRIFYPTNEKIIERIREEELNPSFLFQEELEELYNYQEEIIKNSLKKTDLFRLENNGITLPRRSFLTDKDENSYTVYYAKHEILDFNILLEGLGKEYFLTPRQAEDYVYKRFNEKQIIDTLIPIEEQNILNAAIYLILKRISKESTSQILIYLKNIQSLYNFKDFECLASTTESYIREIQTNELIVFTEKENFNITINKENINIKIISYKSPIIDSLLWKLSTDVYINGTKWEEGKKIKVGDIIITKYELQTFHQTGSVCCEPDLFKLTIIYQSDEDSSERGIVII